MDCAKVGSLIFRLRKEKNMTQKDVASKMNISDKTISKWERGLGCPDVSLLADLSNILGVNIEKILIGDLEKKKPDVGNMKKVRFFVCKDCNNFITSTSMVEIYCCGRKLETMSPASQDENHQISIAEIENDYYITMQHPMSKKHFISFVAYITYDKMLLTKLYPEQNAELRIPKIHQGKLLVYCSEHGLFEKNIC
jgi:transcriptional regulator with XRE-family HTH domain